MSTESGMDYTEAELQGLSDEERAAIADGSDDDAAATDGEEVSGDGDNEDEAPLEEVASDDSPQPEPVDGEPVVSPEPEPKPKPTVDDNQPVTLPADVAESFKVRLADLVTKFEDGDLSMIEMMDQRDAINREIYNAEVSIKEERKAVRSWQEAQDAFFTENAHYHADEKRYADLNVCVKAVASSDAAGNMTLAAILTKAKAMEEAMNGAVKTPAKQQEEKKPLPSSPKPNLPSLKDIPASEMNDTSAGEFAAMDNLKGMDYERALAKMTDAQRERYLKG